MSKDTLLFIGLDTHKESTEVAYVDDHRGSPCQHYGKISTTKSALLKLDRQLVSQHPDVTLHFVYEAGLWLLVLSFADEFGSLLLRGRTFSDCSKAR